MDAAFGHWIAGFADGEGCFVITRGHSHNFEFRFSVKVRIDDRPILEEIVEYTGIGRIYVTKRPTNPRHGPTADWIVGGRAPCLKLIEFFDQYPLRAKKARDYAIWRQAVLEWTRIMSPPAPGRSQRGPRRDWSHIEDLRHQLREGRRWGNELAVEEEPMRESSLNDLVLFRVA